ncbi:major facilitator super transporter protein [Microbotryomycetes sp. JL201]|nr:major facilitator super transporter protein [Microbotryomycetes sp. JL201]
MPYTAIAQAPTVTLPRLKALTTGSNPTFLDAILNIAEDSQSGAALEHTDTWLRQLVKSGRHNRTLFAGDDTWLRLFPTHWFDETDGVSSFFVSDYTVVDHNVSRHLDVWLDRDPFHVLVLHYLGLDHIGHLGGPRHLQMKFKQEEMDLVVERLCNYLAEQDRRDGGNSLIVLTGDHGMTEGNARTSQRSYNELYRYYEKVQQIDLVPTLASLMQVGIPQYRPERAIEFGALWEIVSTNEQVCKRWVIV